MPFNEDAAINSIMAGQGEMPKYKCHKEVWALKIKAISHGEDAKSGETYGGTWLLTPEDARYTPIEVPHAFYVKHTPQVGGYYVVYEGDGYASYSPAKAFEDGYTLKS